MNIILLGPQGSGKGTQAEKLVSKYGFNYVEMGNILRSIAKSDNEYARIVKETTEKGELVSDEYVRLIAWDFINKHDKELGFLFDGYPRSILQYEQLEDMLKKFGKGVDRVISLNISEAESIKRLAGRRVCTKCGEIYNLLTEDKPGADMKCSKCGGELVARDDDLPEAVKRRLQLYHEMTEPILEKARQEGVLMEVDGERSIGAIFEEIVSRLGDGR